jgi:hypothetical protein
MDGVTPGLGIDVEQLFGSGARSVQFNAPPQHLIPDITASISKAIAELPPDADAALVGVANRNGGWNAAFVGRVPGGFEVQAWIGKSWGSDSDLDWGAQIMKTFKFGR